jgi:hypothetical protein
VRDHSPCHNFAVDKVNVSFSTNQGLIMPVKSVLELMTFILFTVARVDKPKTWIILLRGYTKPDTATHLSKISKSDTPRKTCTQIRKSDTFRRKRHGLQEIRHGFQEIRHDSRKPDTPLGYHGLAVDAVTTDLD